MLILIIESKKKQEKIVGYKDCSRQQLHLQEHIEIAILI